MTVATFDAGGLFGLTWDTGISAEAATLKARREQVQSSYTPSVALGQVLADSLAALERIWHEARRDDWDGQGARRVDWLTRDWARRLLVSLWPTIQLPEVAADPDGEISFDWWRGSRQSVSISIGRDGTLTYAALFGRSKAYGTEQFTGDEIPTRVAQILRSHLR